MLCLTLSDPICLPEARLAMVTLSSVQADGEFNHVANWVTCFQVLELQFVSGSPYSIAV